MHAAHTRELPCMISLSDNCYNTVQRQMLAIKSHPSGRSYDIPCAPSRGQVQDVFAPLENFDFHTCIYVPLPACKSLSRDMPEPLANPRLPEYKSSLGAMINDYYSTKFRRTVCKV
jgi:hypothetical protein